MLKPGSSAQFRSLAALEPRASLEILKNAVLGGCWGELLDFPTCPEHWKMPCWAGAQWVPSGHVFLTNPLKSSSTPQQLYLAHQKASALARFRGPTVTLYTCPGHSEKSCRVLAGVLAILNPSVPLALMHQQT